MSRYVKRSKNKARNILRVVPIPLAWYQMPKYKYGFGAIVFSAHDIYVKYSKFLCKNITRLHGNTILNMSWVRTVLLV